MVYSLMFWGAYVDKIRYRSGLIWSLSDIEVLSLYDKETGNSEESEN